MSNKRLPSSSHTPDSYDGDSSSGLPDSRHLSHTDPPTQPSNGQSDSGVRNSLHNPRSLSSDAAYDFDRMESADAAASDETIALPSCELASVTTLLRQTQTGQRDGDGDHDSASRYAALPPAREQSSPPFWEPTEPNKMLYNRTTRTAQSPASTEPVEAQAMPNSAASTVRSTDRPVANGAHDLFRRPQDRVSTDRPAPTSDYSSSQFNQRSSPFQRPQTEPQSVQPVVIQPAVASPEFAQPEFSSAARTIGPSSSVSPLAAVYQQHDAQARVQSVQRSLEDAVETWWTESQLPSKALLRNGLLVLEAGHALDEAHLTLLLRTALRYRRGMLTALKHQTDPDRTAFLLKEALLFERNPLPLETLWMLQAEDPASEEWHPLLDDDLRYHLQSLGPNRRTLALSAIQQLSSDEPISPQAVEAATKIVMSVARPFSWTMGRAILLLLMIPVVISAYSLQAQHSTLTGMAVIPAESVLVDSGFSIDQTEVTNAQYRLCVQQGICSEPTAMSSATRSHYHLNPLYNEYPVVNVDWFMAQQYCEWAGKRLPTAVEWEIAATAAPATARQFEYPWGNTFEQRYANSIVTEVGDTKEVGTYHPAGTSPIGATDMAGNVAEWTTTYSSLKLYEIRPEQLFTAKGGSYNSVPDELRSRAGRDISSTTAEPWLGFRCAMTIE